MLPLPHSGCIGKASCHKMLGIEHFVGVLRELNYFNYFKGLQLCYLFIHNSMGT
jgi:hypothetical protein